MRATRYKQVDFMQTWRFRNTYQQTNTGLPWLNPAITQSTPSGVGGTPITSRVGGVSFGTAQFITRSTTAVVAGMGVRLPNDLWQAGTWTNATTTYTRVVAFQALTSTPIETTTQNDGFAIFSPVPFNAITMNVTTAGSTTSPTHDFAYTGPTGWTTISVANMTVFDGGAADWASGEQIVLVDTPGDWTAVGSQTSGSFGTNAPTGLFGWRIRRTNAVATTAAAITGMEVALLSVLSPGPTGGIIASAALGQAGATFSLLLANVEIQIPYGDAIVSCFSTAANGGAASNSIEAVFRVGTT